MTIHHRWWGTTALAALTLALVATACAPAPAAPAQPAAPAPAAGASKLFLMVDLVQGSKNIPEAQKTARSCVLNSKFPKNSEMVWRARVFDPATGDLMDNKALGKVEIKLANGKNIDMQYGAHPKDPPGEAYWTGSWVVPKDNPTGTLNYSIVATDTKGRTGEFKPFSVAASLPAIVDEVYPDAPPPAK